MKQTIQLDVFQAQAERDKGISVAVSHADEVNPGWSEKAYEMFKDWLKGWSSGYKFLIEDFRKVCQIKGLPDPPSNRAFGIIAVRAKKEGLIKSNGTVKVKNVKAHSANAALWQKL